MIEVTRSDLQLGYQKDRRIIETPLAGSIPILVVYHFYHSVMSLLLKINPKVSPAFFGTSYRLIANPMLICRHIWCF